MNIPIEDRVDACRLEDVSVSLLSSYFIDLDGIEELCENMKDLYNKEQISTLGDEKYLQLMEKEAYLVEDLAITSMRFLREYKKIINIMKNCSTNKRNQDIN
ncbi:hypothetical protein EDI_294350 [Entamoeba dispar SAW760]|uniref:Uncharacterized protein n=1 Tax=Entamoeba dispar (strain ATCC PRA-260 / SAW760) TaxID=370354 RepID=B0EC05_ENTDS|nr:uncharacterized protein EDI_294350 [Entamoeba dispar SAW760]EDR27934.1 hypothetical protein EDI_294350 [Entamoeba dispar SAW760]|eukprot:EDR27934.1 hypothetical protein EDI_294350 [Entamoeba dispar SAW760]